MISGYIICRNCEKTLERAISSLRHQTTPLSEILVVDDGSTDRSPEIARRLADRFISLESSRGRGAARRLAVDSLTTELIASVDASKVVQPDFVARSASYFNSPDVAAVFGQIRLASPRTVSERWCARHIFRQTDAKEVRHHATLNTGAALLRRDAVLAVGNFSEELVELEDSELSSRLSRAGWDVIYDSTLAIEAIASIEIQGALEKYLRWNRQHQNTGPLTLKQYLQSIAYSTKVLAKDDLEQGDPAAALLSLAIPHLQLWNSIAKH